MEQRKQTIRNQIISWLPFTGTNDYMGKTEKVMKEIYNAASIIAVAGLISAGTFNCYFKNGPGVIPSDKEIAETTQMYEAGTIHKIEHKTIEDIE